MYHVERERANGNGMYHYVEYGREEWRRLRFADHNNDDDEWSFGTDYTKEATDKGVSTREIYVEHLLNGTVPDSIRARLLESSEEATATLLERSAEMIENIRRRKELSETDGFDVDADRALSGEPKYYRRKARHRKGRAVKLGVNIGGHADIDSAMLNASAIKVTAVADAFASRGYAVEVSLIIAERYTTQINEVVTCPVKKFTEPMDPERVMSMLCCGGFRYTFFAHQDIVLPQVYKIPVPDNRGWPILYEQLTGGESNEYTFVLENHSALNASEITQEVLRKLHGE